MTNSTSTTHQLSQDFKDQPANPKKMSKPGSQESKAEMLKIVLVGKTGAGRTSTMNAFLGKADVKKSLLSSDKTPCTTETAQCGDQQLFLADTFGLCHTSKSNEQVLSQIIESTFQAKFGQGPHVFLYVQQLENVFTTHDEKMVQVLMEMFGDDSMDYFLPLITHVAGALSEGKKNEITEFIKKVGFKTENYCVIDNKGEKDKLAEKQKELVDKINVLVNKNKAKNKEFYTKEMFNEHVNKQVREKQVDPANKDVTAVVEGILTPILGEPLTQSVLRFNSWLTKKFDNWLKICVT